MNAGEHLPEAYISVDVEAAGPVPGQFSMLSIGACMVEDRGQEFYAELKPISIHYVPKALEVARLSLEELASRGEEPTKAMNRLSEWLANVAPERPPVMVGFNASFDWSFVNYYMHIFHGSNPFGIGALDIKAYYMGLTGCHWDQTKSSKLPSFLRPEENGGQAHNALFDAKQQAEIFRRILLGRGRLAS